MKTRILSGTKVAEAMNAELTLELERLGKMDLIPGLATVLVGDDPASQLYVRNKIRACETLGMHSESIQLTVDTTTGELLKVINRMNQANEIDGILVQSPLPDHINKDLILSAVLPEKDVDGFHPQNVGNLCSGNIGLAPCTPMGIMELLKREAIPVKGMEAVVVGRSELVGKPLALLLLHNHATVTLCHSRTCDLPSVCRRADILVAAVGRPALLDRDYFKEGVVIIDVGINRIDDLEKASDLLSKRPEQLLKAQQKGYALVGDVHPHDPLGIASAVTPVPGGVGPLTIAQLMKNTVMACKMRKTIGPN